ncbi:MAG: 50S ribosomal protein L18 [Gemmatimonadota bacterium]
MSGSEAQRRERVRQRRHRRVRRRISGTKERPRLVVHRSLKNIGAQLVDDTLGRTIVGVSSLSLRQSGTKIEQAQATGKQLAELARERGISRIVFDRGGYLYHGRVKALAEGAREGGLQF